MTGVLPRCLLCGRAYQPPREAPGVLDVPDFCSEVCRREHEIQEAHTPGSRRRADVIRH